MKGRHRAPRQDARWTSYLTATIAMCTGTAQAWTTFSIRVERIGHELHSYPRSYVHLIITHKYPFYTWKLVSFFSKSMWEFIPFPSFVENSFIPHTVCPEYSFPSLCSFQSLPTSLSSGSTSFLFLIRNEHASIRWPWIWQKNNKMI